jgi:hypothetical protein
VLRLVHYHRYDHADGTLWQMASLAQTHPASIRPMTPAPLRLFAVIALATVASGVIAWRFIFPVPALFSSALVIALLAAYVVAR